MDRRRKIQAEIEREARGEDAEKLRRWRKKRLVASATETDCVLPACKIGMLLDPIKAVRLMGILASADCVQRLVRVQARDKRPGIW